MNSGDVFEYIDYLKDRPDWDDLDVYDLDDPKRWSLDPDFDPDLVRDMERGK